MVALLLSACSPEPTETAQDEMDHSAHAGMDMGAPDAEAQDMAMETDEPGVVVLDARTIQQTGVRTAVVEVAPLTRRIRTTGHFVMDEQAERTISPKVSGFVEHLEADFDGKKVLEGDHLFDLYSPEVLATQEDLLTARNVDERLAEAARQRLRLWNIPESVIEQVESTGVPIRAVPFYAPSDGEIMRKKVTEGAFVRAGDRLMDIVDISRTWLIVDVHEQDLPWVGIGTKAHVELPYDPGNYVVGEINYVYHMLNEPLRAARARIVLSGGHHAPFKPGMFATVTLEGQPTPAGPLVPTEAIVRDGQHEMVILAEGDGRFRPVAVRTGEASDGLTRILEGLSGGEEVVVSAQFLIDSETRLGSAMQAMAGHDM
jgi:multidrug efflux pump subunit AcrA (membrane-fusion protein)